MKTAMKKVLSLSLVLVLLLGAFPMAAFATEVDGEAAPADMLLDDFGIADDGMLIDDNGVAAADIGGMLPNPEDQGFEIYDPGPVGGRDPIPEFNDHPTWPGPQEPAATSLTVKFYVDNALKETATHNAAASVQELIQICCTVDNNVALHYSGARVENTPYDLGDVVALGEEVHIYLYTETTVVESTPLCRDCKVDPCICCECGGTEVQHRRNCPNDPANDPSRNKVNLILNYNYHGAKYTTMKVERNAKIIDIVAGIPAPTRDGHLFSHWTLDQAGEDRIDDERVTAEGIVIYAQWDDDLAIGGKYTIRVNLNYERKMGEPLTNIKKGTRMGDVLDYVTEPTRWNHKFVGWYWDRDCKDPVKDSDKVYQNDEIFAKWEYRRTNNEVMLKIFLNGNTKSVAKIVDLYDYSRDGEISMSEVKEVVKKYYTAKDSDGMSYVGLFEEHGWSEYVRNHKHNRGANEIDVRRHDDTTIYVMVHNATVRTSSSASADPSNPKTGDMIMTAVTGLGASATCLAVLFYLNKKRAV